MISRREDVCRPSRCSPCGVVFAIFLANLAWAQAASAAARRSIGRSRPFRLVGGCAERVLALERESPAGETVVWTGACGADGRAIGQGVREWRTPGSDWERECPYLRLQRSEADATRSERAGTAAGQVSRRSE